MASNQRNRVSNAIDSLITHLVPGTPHDDEQAVQERHDACFELVRTILDRSELLPSDLRDVHSLTLPQTRLSRHLVRRQPCLGPHQAQTHPEQPQSGPEVLQPLHTPAFAPSPQPEMGDIVLAIPALRFSRPERASAAQPTQTARPTGAPSASREGPALQGVSCPNTGGGCCARGVRTGWPEEAAHRKAKTHPNRGKTICTSTTCC
jgi:hypothetical protein